jgi:hypothetical protein
MTDVIVKYEDLESDVCKDEKENQKKILEIEEIIKNANKNMFLFIDLFIILYLFWLALFLKNNGMQIMFFLRKPIYLLNKVISG